MSRLAVIVDGTPMPETEALALWDRFSRWMEEHRGDLAGFAAQEGYASVHPGVDGDRPLLRVSKSAAQRPYGDPTPQRPGGSQTRQSEGQKPDQARGNHPKKADKTHK